METVTHHGRETAYRTVDTEGLRALYVHGSGADHRVWATQYRHGGVALDLSGHGDSEDVDAEPGYETLSAYADDVLAVAEATDAAVFVGNSLGGAICLHIALERPIEPDGLVLAGTGAKLGVLSSLREWLEDDFERAIEFLHEPGKLFAGEDDGLDRDVLERSKATMRETGRAVTQRDYLTCHRFDVRGRLGEIETPALVVCGERDRLTPPEYHEYLAEHLPNAELVVLPGAAHLTMIERPGAFAEALEGFVADLGR